METIVQMKKSVFNWSMTDQPHTSILREWRFKSLLSGPYLWNTLNSKKSPSYGRRSLVGCGQFTYRRYIALIVLQNKFWSSFFWQEQKMIWYVSLVESNRSIQQRIHRWRHLYDVSRHECFERNCNFSVSFHFALWTIPQSMACRVRMPDDWLSSSSPTGNDYLSLCQEWDGIEKKQVFQSN